MRRLFLAGIAFLSAFAMANTTAVEELKPVGQRIQEVVETPAHQPAVSAWMEFRPTYNGSKDTLNSENEVGASYSITSDITLGYTQYITFTDMYNAEPGSDSMDVVVNDGFFRAKMANIWTSSDDSWTLNYEPRLYMPTNTAKREAGLITYWRNNISLTKQFTSSFSTSFYAIPMVHLYSKSGHVTDGEAKANPLFEARAYVIPSYQITSKLSASLPVLFYPKYHRNFARAANSDKWSLALEIWPDVTYQVNNNINVGLAFRTDNAIVKNNSLKLGEAFKNGSFQAILRASL